MRNAVSKALVVSSSSAQSVRAASTNRSDCALSVNLYFRLGFGFGFSAIALTSADESFDK